MSDKSVSEFTWSFNAVMLPDENYCVNVIKTQLVDEVNSRVHFDLEVLGDG